MASATVNYAISNCSVLRCVRMKVDSQRWHRSNISTASLRLFAIKFGFIRCFSHSGLQTNHCNLSTIKSFQALFILLTTPFFSIFANFCTIFAKCIMAILYLCVFASVTFIMQSSSSFFFSKLHCT